MNRLITYDSLGRMIPAHPPQAIVDRGDWLWVEKSDRCELLGVVVGVPELPPSDGERAFIQLQPPVVLMMHAAL